ncbi:MAG TPA: hypothetical protein VIV11_00715 [Kofleriaceae bacterium]
MSRIVVLLVLLSGCDLLFQLRHVDDRDAGGDGGPLGAWPTPVVMPVVNVLGNNEFETDPSMTSDELEIFFSSNRPGGLGGFDIWRARRDRVTDAFSAPVHVPELSTPQNEWGFITADGKKFYFWHGVPSNVEVATRPDRDSPFSMLSSEPQLSALVGAGNVELSGNGLYAIVNAASADMGQDLYLFARVNEQSNWSAPMRQLLVNSEMLDAGGSLDEQALLMVFHSDRNAGTRQIWMATRTDTDVPFATPTQITELGDGGDPWLAPNARTIVFNRDGDLYISTR